MGGGTFEAGVGEREEDALEARVPHYLDEPSAAFEEARGLPEPRASVCESERVCV